MFGIDRGTTGVYPVLGSDFDLGFVRISGHGLGNCFYTYFHASVLAERYGARLITPPWFCLKVGPLLRGASSKRLYWRMFRPLPGDLDGAAKLYYLLRGRRDQQEVIVGGPDDDPVLVPGVLNRVTSGRFTFRGLHAHRERIRMRLLGIVCDPLPEALSWGKGDYAAVHVRLGDFADVRDPALLVRGAPNFRIPLSWYVAVVGAIRKRRPELPIYVFSDGDPPALGPLIELGARLYRSGSDITDLLTMAGASLLVGSNSTYSRWAAFLGNMPSVWLETLGDFEPPTDRETPLKRVALDATEPDLW